MAFNFCSFSISQDLENIVVPYSSNDNTGIIPQDIIVTENIFNSNTSGLIFIHSFRDILVYKNDMTFQYKIGLSNYSRNNERYSEFDRIPSISYMAFNTADKELYYIDPTAGEDVNIKYIKFNDIGGVDDTGIAYSPFSGSPTDWFNLGGYTILKFNENSKRLFFIINGTGIDGINSFLGVYSRGTGSYPSFSYVHEESNSGNEDFYDVSFNIENDGVSIDHFFVSIDNFWEIYEIDATGNTYLKSTQSLQAPGNEILKNGWFLPLYKLGVYNKVLCLPHNDHFDGSGIYKVYEIDCSQTTPSFTETSIPIPQSRVFNSGAIHLNSNLVILCTKPTGPDDDIFYYYDAINTSNTGIINGTHIGDDINNLGTYMLCYDNTFVLARKNNIESFQCQNTTPIQITNQNNILTKSNNYFTKPIINSNGSNNSKLLVLNLLGAGFERFDKNGSQYNIPQFGSFIQTGYAMYESVFNPINSIAYFYSLTDHGSSDIFAVDTESNNVSKFKSLQNSIGGCVYNPFTNELLVSKYDAIDNEIFVYNVETGALNNTISISESNYLESMFISEQGLLYTTSGMHYDAVSPYIHIYDASTSDYPLHASIEIENIITSSEEYSRLKAGFCDNGDNGVFTFVSVVSETATDLRENNAKGVFFNIDKNYNVVQDNGDANYRKVFYDNNTEKTHVLTDNDIFSFSYTGNAGNPFTEPVTVPVPDISIVSAIDMDHDKITDRLYFAAFNDTGGNTLWTVSPQNEPQEIISFNSDDKEIISIYFNEVNMSLYAYLIPKDGNESDRSTYLYWYDQIEGSTGYIELVDSYNDLANKCLPDTKDDGYIYYNRNQIICDPYNLKLYVPNGMQSNISSISIDYEYINLGQGIKWFSYPRIENMAGSPQSIFSTDAMDEMITGSTFDDGLLTFYDGGNNNSTFLDWNIISGSWLPRLDDELDYIFSKNGYKLDFNDTEKRLLKLSGNVENPNLQFNISAENENWVGYYLPNEQSPFDAISEEILDELYLIKAQYWTCVNTWCDNNQSPCWICAVSKGVDEPLLKYGDMVILETISQDIDNFQWQTTVAKSTTEEERAETSNYSYIEKTDYIPIFIELDTTNNPLEIGAFINDSCIGATTVLTEDSVVLLATYTEGLSGEVYFEEYYGNTKSMQPVIKSYNVKDNVDGSYTNRTIKIIENKPYYMVSFRDKKNKNTEQEIANGLNISCYPNPATGSCTISYSIDSNVSAFVEIYVYDMFGNKKTELQKGEIVSGNYNIGYDCCNSQGNKLENGVYFIEMKYGEQHTQCKLIVINN